MSGTCKVTAPTTTAVTPVVTSGCASWEEESNTHCSGNSFPTPYINLAQAQSACAKLGSRCGGVYNFGCNSNGGFLLCKPGVYRASSSGSCVCTRPVAEANRASPVTAQLSGPTLISPVPSEIAASKAPAKTTGAHTTTSSTCGSWHEVSNRHCSDNSLPIVYSTLTQAQTQCVHLGADCGGIYNFGCGTSSSFVLCKPGDFRPSGSGSCICTQQTSVSNTAIATPSAAAKAETLQPHVKLVDTRIANSKPEG